MTPAQRVLLAAAELLDQPGAWTTNTMARDTEGTPVPPTAESARCWCAAGAMIRVAGPFAPGLPSVDLVCEAKQRFAFHLGIATGPGPWNDEPGRSQAEVVAALRAAAGAA